MVPQVRCSLQWVKILRKKKSCIVFINGFCRAKFEQQFSVLQIIHISWKRQCYILHF